MYVSSLDSLNWYQDFSSKAVAEGAISHILNHLVVSRMSRYTYGIKGCTTFVPHIPEHVARRHTCRIHLCGDVSVPGAFLAILEKVIVHLSGLSLSALVLSTYINRILWFWKKKNSEALYIANSPRRSFIEYQYIRRLLHVIGVTKQRHRPGLIKILVRISCW